MQGFSPIQIGTRIQQAVTFIS